MSTWRCRTFEIGKISLSDRQIEPSRDVRYLVGWLFKHRVKRAEEDLLLPSSSDMTRLVPTRVIDHSDEDAEGEPDPTVTNLTAIRDPVSSPSPSAVSVSDSMLSDDAQTKKGVDVLTSSFGWQESYAWEQIQLRIKDLERMNEELTQNNEELLKNNKNLSSDNDRLRESRRSANNEISVLKQQCKEAKGRFTLALRDVDIANCARDQALSQHDTSLVEIEQLKARIRALESRNRYNNGSNKRPRVKSPVGAVDKRTDHRLNDRRRSGGGASAVNARNASASTSSVSRSSVNAQASTSSANDTSGIQSFSTSRSDETPQEMPDAMSMDLRAAKKYLARLSIDECRPLGVMRKSGGLFEIGTVRFAVLA
jgi:hypothetical protein